ncbi:MAG: NAD(+) diphosphatase [Chloroflexota bacterium]|jgi:NAD+ diphosphatase|nr:NAD(+) diphosphatase [Chloroflexota bacterium]
MFDLQSAAFISLAAAPGDEPEHEPAYWFLFQGDKLLVRPGPTLVAVPEARDASELGIRPAHVQFMGYLQDAHGERKPCYSGDVDPSTPLPDGMQVEGLRELHAQLGDTLFGLAGRAVQIAAWDRTHQFCGQCGAHTQTLGHERAKRCPECGMTSYPRLSPAIIIAVTRRTEAGNLLLMARNHRFPPGRYSVVAGFVEPGESLEDAARREVREETAIRIKNIRYFGSQPWPFPNSLMIGFTAEYDCGEIVIEEAEIADARWFAADEMPRLPPKISIARRLIDWFLAENGGGPVQEW